MPDDAPDAHARCRGTTEIITGATARCDLPMGHEGSHEYTAIAGNRVTFPAPAPDAPAARRVTAQPLSAQDMPEVDCCPMCASVGIDKVQERTKGRWGDRPEVEFDDEVWRCVDCGEEWYDPHMANRHTLQLLKATLAAAEARAVRAEGERARLAALQQPSAAHQPEEDRR